MAKTFAKSTHRQCSCFPVRIAPDRGIDCVESLLCRGVRILCSCNERLSVAVTHRSRAGALSGPTKFPLVIMRMSNMMKYNT